MSRIGIAGAGIAGRLLAFQLSRLGHEVDVFDPAPDGAAPDGQRPHAAAAFTAAGMLSPLAELEHAPADIAERGWRSLDLWPGVVAALGPRYDTPSLFRRNGSVLVAHPGDTGATQRVLARMKAANARSAREHALRGRGVARVRDEHAAVAPEQAGRAKLGRDGADDAGPQVERAPAERGHFLGRVLELGERAQHAGGGERGRAVGLGERRGFAVGRRVEDLDLVPQPRKLPRDQTPGDAGPCDSDSTHSASAS